MEALSEKEPKSVFGSPRVWRRKAQAAMPVPLQVSELRDLSTPEARKRRKDEAKRDKDTAGDSLIEISYCYCEFYCPLINTARLTRRALNIA